MADGDVTQAVMDVLRDPMNLPPEFWNYMIQRWLADAPVFPISQVFGFTQFTANQSVIATQESTTSTSYTDLATVGPQLTGLPDGNYILFFGCANISNTNATASSWISLQTNAATATDAESCIWQGGNSTAVSRAVIKPLSNSGSNTVTMKYKTNANTSTFINRWLVALKYSNL